MSRSSVESNASAVSIGWSASTCATVSSVVPWAELSRELFVRHDAVCVLPYDPLRDRVVLIEQFRVGALGKVDNPWLIELVAGLIDKDEAPDQVARREAVEEAGLELGELWPITRYFPSPGGSDERVHLYIGRCDSEGADGVFGLAEEGEDIRVHVWSLQEALRAISDGRSTTRPASLHCSGWP